MGLCSSCLSVPAPNQQRPLVKSRHLPLLHDLEHEFTEAAGEDHQLTLEELTSKWKDIAKRKTGKLTEDDEWMIQETAATAFKHMDLDNSGKVGVHEFLIYNLGGMENRGALRTLRKNMQQDFKVNPQKLQRLVERFRAWDRNGDGFISSDELDAPLAELAGLALEDGMDESMRGTQTTQQASKLKEEFKELDVDGDNRVDLWEVIAHALGRRKTPVELLLYDLAKGASKYLGQLIAGRKDIEVFHSSVLVFGSEYWYGGKVFRSVPPVSDQFGQPLRKVTGELKLEPSEIKPELMVVRMGYTLLTHEEFMDFMDDQIIPNYTGIEKYDLLTHSCNHMSDELLKFLIGQGVPEHVLELQRMAFCPAVKSMRPYLNKYLGGFSQVGTDEGKMSEDAEVLAHTEPVNPHELLGEGSAVLLEMQDLDDGFVVAVVVRESGGTCDVKYFDTEQQTVTEKKEVPVALIKRRMTKQGSSLSHLSQ